MIYLILRNGKEPRRGDLDWLCIHKDRKDAHAAFGRLPVAPDEFAQLVEVDSIQGTWKPIINRWGRDAANSEILPLFS